MECTRKRPSHGTAASRPDLAAILVGPRLLGRRYEFPFTRDLAGFRSTVCIGAFVGTQQLRQFRVPAWTVQRSYAALRTESCNTARAWRRAGNRSDLEQSWKCLPASVRSR